jgi:glutathione S-transferase
MRPIYLLASRPLWEREPDQPYRTDSLAGEGFIHCCFADQVAAAANRFYATATEVLVVTLDPARLTHPLREELSSSGKLFPHVYGPINRDAVTAVVPLAKGVDGRWGFVP